MINKRKIISWSLLIIWITFIYFMSNQPATVSDNQSESVIILLTKIGIDMNGIFGQLANFIVRKSAHFIEYMILALLVFNTLIIYFDIKKVIPLSILFVFIYACSDEIHQLFVPGREGTIRDVIIDTCGGITLILIKLFILHHNKKIKWKNNIYRN